MEPTSQAAEGGVFPHTRRSLVAAVGSGDGEVRRSAFGALVEAYWKPVYKLLRLRWRLSPDAAEDATQEFFARAFEKDWFSRYDSARARFRTYLRTCLDGYAANRAKAARREKRGGGAAPLSLDFAAAEGEVAHLEPATEAEAEELFYREWVRGLFEIAVDRFRRRMETVLGAFLAWLVTLDTPYLWEIVIPGTLVGLIVGIATQRWRSRPAEDEAAA